MQRPDLPLTRDGALAWARHCAPDPAQVRPFPHAELEADETCGGFAFTDGARLYVALRDGGCGWSSIEGRDATGIVDDHLARGRHAHRDLAFDDLGPWQQAAVTAVRRGLTVAAVCDARLADVADRDWADWIWIQLRRSPHDPIAALAAQDTLMRPPPPPGRNGCHTHPCPLCGCPAPHQDRYPRAVCDDCSARTTDSLGRAVRGRNVSLSGGFEARLVDADGADLGASDEVTSSGRCRVDDRPCTMREARFGGIVVEALPR